LFPIRLEPFGLVMIEAIAAGTPIVAGRNVSVPEVITDHVSGVIVDSLDTAVAAVQETATMSRATVRGEFEARFILARMARNYAAPIVHSWRAVENRIRGGPEAAHACRKGTSRATGRRR
jgi:glycosyltransferase involved in cell wall biosynthesis